MARPTEQDNVRELQRTLYRAAKADPYGDGRAPAVKDVGEPCAGEPHARFAVAAGGNRCRWSATAARNSAPPADPPTTRRLSGSLSFPAAPASSPMGGSGQRSVPVQCLKRTQLEFCLFSGITARRPKMCGLWPFRAPDREILPNRRKRSQRARHDRQAVSSNGPKR